MFRLKIIRIILYKSAAKNEPKRMQLMTIKLNKRNAADMGQYISEKAHIMLDPSSYSC